VRAVRFIGRTALALTVALSVAGGQRKNESDSARQETVTAEEYAVFATVAESLFKGHESRKILLQARTVSFACGPASGNLFAVVDGCSGMRAEDEMPKETMKYLQESFQDLGDDTAKDFLRKNTTYYLLENLFPMKHDYLWVGEKDQVTMIGKKVVKDVPDEWKNVDIVGFSRAGFSGDEKQALVYFVVVCHEHCGGWLGYLLLKREGSAWVVTENCEVGYL
jgi:hypothetical protein